MKLKNLFQSGKDNAYPISSTDDDEICCGEHEVCEKEKILKSMTLPAEYYDDEELDIFQGRSSDNYNEEEVAVFAEILHTMWETDIPGWVRSLQIRGIELPDSLKDEVLLFLKK